MKSINKATLFNDVHFSGVMTLPGGYELITLYPGGSFLWYYLVNSQSCVIFSGKDFKGSPLYNIDSIENIISLLGFLTLKPGDTDSEYFAKYTREQFDFAASNESEEIKNWISDFENGETESAKEYARQWCEFRYRQDMTPRHGLYNVTLNAAENHNSDCDILQAQISPDEMITYIHTVNTVTAAIVGASRGMEYYRGENYVKGSNKRSYSRMYQRAAIPKKYRAAWDELKYLYSHVYDKRTGA